MEPSTSSDLSTIQPTESTPTGSPDTPAEEMLPRVKSIQPDKREGGDEDVTEEVPKKRSSIRFRRKIKTPKQQQGEGL